MAHVESARRSSLILRDHAGQIHKACLGKSNTGASGVIQAIVSRARRTSKVRCQILTQLRPIVDLSVMVLWNDIVHVERDVVWHRNTHLQYLWHPIRYDVQDLQVPTI